MILATDLDGTFLGGNSEKRRALYELIKASQVDLIYVTGRGIETVLPLLSDSSLPKPRFIIADVGATVVHGDTLESVQPLQEEIFQSWRGTHEVVSAFQDILDLKRQTVPQERRVSYELSNLNLLPEIQKRAEQLGLTLIFSAGKFVDLLPRGVSKGNTLASLISLYDLNEDLILIAGDSMNDFSMFQLGLKSVVVGGGEKVLLSTTKGWSNIIHAKEEGAGGILEAMEHFEMVDFPKQASIPVAPKGESQLVVVYHRMPYEESFINEQVQMLPPKSPNGIIPTLLGLFREGRHGSWVAWCERQSREVNPGLPEKLDPVLFPNLKMAPVPLTKSDVDTFYKIFSKEAFWPIIFSFPSKVIFNHLHWKVYCEVNRLFAERTAREADEGAVVWIHDYNLWMVPAYLRPLRPDLKISFFHHTSFPSPDVFNILPWRREIVGSLLQCDHVGFHIPSYAENFANVIRSNVPSEVIAKADCAPRFSTYGCALGIDQYTRMIEANGRRISIGAAPVGIDLALIERTLRSPEVRAKIAEMREGFRGKIPILSIERLDYVKGPLEKLAAFEGLLERFPELHEKVVFINVCTPPAPEIEVYQEVRQRVDQIIGRINGRFSNVRWTPILYFFRSLSFEEVLSYYAVSRIAWITPLRDGLNLVAKEFIAAKSLTDKDGTLVLSEFAGAAVELFGAMLTNPYDPEDMIATLYRSLQLSPIERRSRLRRLTAIVKSNDIEAWSSECLKTVEELSISHKTQSL